MSAERRLYRTASNSLAPSAAKASTHSKQRNKLRRKLRAKGLSEEQIAEIIERQRLEQEIARYGVEEATRRRYESIAEPDDAKHKPAQHDPLLNGVARATGITAKVVAARRTITKTQYEERAS